MERTIHDRMKEHRETIGTNAPVVFCCRCGSTILDQNFINELRCYNCHNTMRWDGTRFSIRRYLDEIGESDVEDGFASHDKAARSKANRRG
jgi:hypothetical protein